MMILKRILHVSPLYVTGKFKKPQILTWLAGFALASVTIDWGVTNYSLPWDKVGYWAC